MSSIDPQTRRRIGKTGLTAIDKEKCCPGYLLYFSGWNNGTAHVVDVDGNMIRELSLPYPPAFWGYLLPNGNLFCTGHIDDDVVVIKPGWVEKGGIMYEMTNKGEVVWEYRNSYQHHDARRTSTGGVMHLAVERVPDEIARGVKGGLPESEENGMWSDVIIEVDSAGNRIWEWHAYKHLDPEVDILPPNVAREEWSHGNTVVPIDDKRVLVSFRHISTVAIIDKESGEFSWKLGSAVFSGQHDPSMLSNGNVLVFDNGIFRQTTHNTFSRVIEVNPSTNDIEWKYQDMPANNFYSPFIGGARRLPNGNTLITEGWFGRMFQVTPEGEVVWEYINPKFSDPALGFSNLMFRASHYSAEQMESFL